MEMCFSVLSRDDALDYSDFTPDVKTISVMRRREVNKIYREMAEFKTETVSEFVKLLADTEERVYITVEEKMKQFGQSGDNNSDDTKLRELLSMTGNFADKVSKSSA